MNTLKKISTILMSLLVLTSSMGFTVYIHHCHENETTSLALFDFASCDHHDNHHETKHTNSCNNALCCSQQNNEPDCCSDRMIFIKQELLSNAPSVLTFSIQPIHIPAQVFENSFINDFVSFYSPINFIEKPPPKGSRFMLILFKNLKLPAFLG